MPKQKTRKSVVKRFRLTKKGKLLHRAQHGRHLRRKKSKDQQRRVRVLREVSGKLKSKLIKMI